MRAVGSVGRAPALQAGGREFESPTVHMKQDFFKKSCFFVANFWKITYTICKFNKNVNFKIYYEE